MTSTEYLKEYESLLRCKTSSEATIRNYLSCTESFFNFCIGKKGSPSELLRKYSSRTINLHRAAIIKFFSMVKNIIITTSDVPSRRCVKGWQFMKCRRCRNETDHLWNDLWELCDECGYRYDVQSQRSPDGDCQPITQQSQGVSMHKFVGLETHEPLLQEIRDILPSHENYRVDNGQAICLPNCNKLEYYENGWKHNGGAFVYPPNTEIIEKSIDDIKKQLKSIFVPRYDYHIFHRDFGRLPIYLVDWKTWYMNIAIVRVPSHLQQING